MFLANGPNATHVLKSRHNVTAVFSTFVSYSDALVLKCSSRVWVVRGFLLSLQVTISVQLTIYSNSGISDLKSYNDLKLYRVFFNKYYLQEMDLWSLQFTPEIFTCLNPNVIFIKKYYLFFGWSG
jgi:hypothetical protein